MLAIRALTGSSRVKLSSVLLQRNFHKSPPKQAIPPQFLILIRPLLKGAAFFAGRSFRKWWRGLPKEKKEIHYQKLKARKNYIAGGGVLASFLAVWYYETHSQETPITKRKRFVTINAEQLGELSNIEFLTVCNEYFDKILHTDHPSYQRISKVVQRILQANKTLPEIYTKTWTITVLNEPTILNAFVLPNGNIFVFTGLLDLCATDDELAIILSHELAHSLLAHASENVTRESLIDWLKTLLIGLSWAILPTDLSSFLFYCFSSETAEILWQFPYSRLLENEADDVGLVLAAKACFDVRSASAFWSKMETMSELREENDIEWLSTHPSNQSRQKRIDDCLPALLQFRLNCQCPDLPNVDPRHEVEAFKKAILESQATRPVAMLVQIPDIKAAVSP